MSDPTPLRPVPRLLQAVFGGVLLVAAALLATHPGGLADRGDRLGFAALLALGIEEVACAVAARRSLLARIGPLP